MMCVSREVEYSGAKAKVTIHASTRDLCNDIMRAIGGGVGAVMEFIRSHGGCYITSENPLVVRSRDGKVEVVIEPANFIARLFWGEAIERVREICK